MIEIVVIALILHVKKAKAKKNRRLKKIKQLDIMFTASESRSQAKISQELVA